MPQVKRRQCAIKGVLKNGEWVEDPGLVKAEFLDHFRNHFEQHTGIPPSLDSDMLNPLSHCHRDLLKRPFSRVERRSAVLDCGGDRAPCPDGFTFKIFMPFWDLIEDDVALFVHEFFRSYHFPTAYKPIGCQYKIIGKLLANRLSTVIRNCTSPVQSAFIKGRNILDGSLILNEVLAWYRQRKKELMIFKIDFEKAFDSLRWDFLELILDKLGFGIKWGLRQGDLMSPFLFILAMEGLHALTSKAEALGLFKGAFVGRNNMYISLLMYADDVYVRGRRYVLCNVLGVGVTDAEVSNMANIIIYGAANFPLKYLGISVKWDRCLASRKEGGLGIGSILECSWCGGGINIANRNQKCSTGSFLLSLIASLEQKGIDLIYVCSCKIGNGADSQFWEDTWCGDQPLKAMFPRIYLLDTDKSCSITSRVRLLDWSSVLRRNPRGVMESF
nr:hypothetical protein [Tanacetum cinerariifolium]